MIHWDGLPKVLNDTQKKLRVPALDFLLAHIVPSVTNSFGTYQYELFLVDHLVES
jgi:hypothetical protein